MLIVSLDDFPFSVLSISFFLIDIYIFFWLHFQVRFVLNIVRFVTLHCKWLNRLLDCNANANRSI